MGNAGARPGRGRPQRGRAGRGAHRQRPRRGHGLLRCLVLAPSPGRVDTPGDCGLDAHVLTVDVEHRLAEVRRRIASTGVDPGDLTIVAVAKGFGPEAVRAAVAAGLRDIGENYAQELSEKAGALAGDAPGADAGAGKSEVRWHFLGPVQRNKVKLIAA